jgi:hypothetical protein
VVRHAAIHSETVALSPDTYADHSYRAATLATYSSLLGSVTWNLAHCEEQIQMRMRGERPGSGVQFADRGPARSEAELFICLLPDVHGVSRWLFQCPANWDVAT